MFVSWDDEINSQVFLESHKQNSHGSSHQQPAINYRLMNGYNDFKMIPYMVIIIPYNDVVIKSFSKMDPVGRSPRTHHALPSLSAGGVLTS